MQSQIEPRERIRSLVCSLPSPERDTRLLAVLVCYADETSEGGVYCIAGYVAPCEAWCKLSDEWSKVLKEKPALSCFHMSEIGKVKERRRIDKLVRIIQKHVTYGIHCTFPEREYRSIFAPELFGEVQSEPYYFAFNNIIMSACGARTALKLRDKIKFVFDWREDELAEATRAQFRLIFKALNPDEKDIISGEPTFEKKEEFVPLQAADMFAWYIRRFAAHGPERDGGSVLTELMKPGCNNGYWNMERFMRELIMPVCTAIVFGHPIKFDTTEQVQRAREINRAIRKGFLKD